ncbi:hypothetical protein GWK36_05360 [Caldichromatium japonicum]|uniref:HPt domain-containing protein n=1 Tax=Caldichromatium japonicum TaxID=2699430 RepID=A0A6G7VBV7_9GAMM|nr:hypothetical protein GWK36_05360 [Caldichromatium japonicum]
MPVAIQDPLFQERKHRLRQSFIAQLPGRLDQARNLLQQINSDAENPLQTQELLNQLHVIFHTLKGSGASFGSTSINTLAQQAEQSLREVLDGERRLSPQLIAELYQDIESLAGLDLNDLQISKTPEAVTSAAIVALYLAKSAERIRLRGYSGRARRVPRPASVPPAGAAKAWRA